MSMCVRKHFHLRFGRLVRYLKAIAFLEVSLGKYLPDFVRFAAVIRCEFKSHLLNFGLMLPG